MNILSYIVAIAALIIVLKIISLPLKLITKFVFNSIIGGIILAICFRLGFVVVISWWMVVLTGLFGVPGLVISMLITIFL